MARMGGSYVARGDKRVLVARTGFNPVNEVINAIQQLDPAKKSLFDKNGKPKVDALEDLVECEVTAQLRDKALAEIKRRDDQANNATEEKQEGVNNG